MIGYLEKSAHEASSIAKIDSHKIAVGDRGGLVRIFDVSNIIADRETQFGDLHTIGTMSKDPNRNWLWTLVGNSVRILDLDTMNVSPPHKTSDETINIAHNATDQTTVVALRGGVFHRYRTTDKAELIEVDKWVNQGQRVYFTTFDSQSGNLITVGADGDILRWQPRPLLRTEFTAQSISPGSDGIHSFHLVPGPSGQWPVVVGDQSGTLFRLDTSTTSTTDLGFNIREFHKFAIIDEHRFVLPNDKSGQCIFDQRSRTFTKLPVPNVSGYSNMLPGNWLVDTDLTANRMRLVDLQNPKERIELTSYNPFCACIALRSRKVFWNNENSVMLRSLDANDPETILEAFSRNPNYLQLSPDENLLAIGLGDREVHLWDWRANKPVGPVMMHDGTIHAVAFSPSGRTLMSVDESATLRFWNITTGQQVSQTNLGIKPDSLIRQAKFTSDGNFVVILHGDTNITTVRIR